MLYHADENWLPNDAGRSGADLDTDLAAELTAAGIRVETMPEILRTTGEVKTVIVGTLHGWVFKRSWRYWVAEGPGLPPTYADPLHAKAGKDVRVAGHCGCPSPFEWHKGFGVGLYHVDTSAGLAALASALNQCAADAAASH